MTYVGSVMFSAKTCSCTFIVKSNFKSCSCINLETFRRFTSLFTYRCNVHVLIVFSLLENAATFCMLMQTLVSTTTCLSNCELFCFFLKTTCDPELIYLHPLPKVVTLPGTEKP